MARGRGKGWGASPRKQVDDRVEWHEIKSAVIYRLHQRAENQSGRGVLTEKYAVATRPELLPWILERLCTRRRCDGGWGVPRPCTW